MPADLPAPRQARTSRARPHCRLANPPQIRENSCRAEAPPCSASHLPAQPTSPSAPQARRTTPEPVTGSMAVAGGDGGTISSTARKPPAQTSPRRRRPPAPARGFHCQRHPSAANGLRFSRSAKRSGSAARSVSSHDDWNVLFLGNRVNRTILKVNDLLHICNDL
ncbi:MAG: hypothetical protein KatS3mg055_1690 [Chloroflexus sp.]|nr:MAG: hypothetical protein KatS3mg055_1690 [Chloroflexus sp.]